jgi:peptidoglycan/LPS O-acetylase OafA/YrhL
MDAKIPLGPGLLRDAPVRGTKMIQSLTTLRFFAAMFVVIHHVSLMAGNLMLVKAIGEVGWLGVSFFFILSGFVLMWSFEAQIPPGRYILRRLARIYPLHVACLAVCLIFYFETGIVLGGHKGTVAATIANFCLVQDWLPWHPEIRQAWNGVSWSLSCEFFFYSAAPFIFRRVLSIRSLQFAVLMTGIWLMVLALSFAREETITDFLIYHPVAKMAEFLLGAAGASLSKAGWRFRSPALAMALMTLPVLAFQDFTPSPLNDAATIEISFIPGCLLLIIAVAGHEIDGKRSWLQHPWLVQLGDASFALYMTHALMLGLFGLFLEKFFNDRFYASAPLEWSLVCLYAASAVLVAVAVHFGLERPARRRLLRLFEGRRRTT